MRRRRWLLFRNVAGLQYSTAQGRSPEEGGQGGQKIKRKQDKWPRKPLNIWPGLETETETEKETAARTMTERGRVLGL